MKTGLIIACMAFLILANVLYANSQGQTMVLPVVTADRSSDCVSLNTNPNQFFNGLNIWSCQASSKVSSLLSNVAAPFTVLFAAIGFGFTNIWLALINSIIVALVAVWTYKAALPTTPVF